MKYRHVSMAMTLLLFTLVGCDENITESEEKPVTENIESNTTASIPTEKEPTGQKERAASTEHTSRSVPDTKNDADIVELEWDDLIPADWRLDKLIEDYNINELDDDDPRAAELMKKIEIFWKEAPVVNDHDGKRVKLPGFVVPLEADAKKIHEFLLVPYYGACIHTPPPPANQTVYVVINEGDGYAGGLFDTVWVTGTFKVEKFNNELGTAGYRIQASQVDPYEEIDVNEEASENYGN
ncbi:MAG: DUF3299 domain-containing protein [Pseudomonadales bacterium]|nr:DUF3299 domain-containing protein [Pseudomonadales bacterium]